MNRKCIIVSAPSGAGKTTLVRGLLLKLPFLEFSVSACSRSKRDGEVDSQDYYFLNVDIFLEKIRKGEFAEWQEVYPGRYYGTLKSELERIWALGKTPIFDVDVVGGLNLKKYFGENGLSIFVHPPSFQDLESRLRNRGTEHEKDLEQRLSKASYEFSFASQFDVVIINDNREIACQETAGHIQRFIDKPASM